MNIYISGIGVISAIGLNVQENLETLKAQTSGIKQYSSSNSDQPLLLGKVNLSNDELRDLTQSRNPISRTSLLGLMAAKEAWGKNTHNNKVKTGIISSTSVGGMDKSEIYYQNRLEGKLADPSFIVTHDNGNTTEKIAEQLNISGYINTLSTACSSAANAIMLGARLLRQGKLDRVLVGGSDSLTNFTIEGFKSLMIYSDEWVKPFDNNRKGLNLGEGAGFLLLENEKSLKETKNTPLAQLAGWSNAADAYHQTASSPEGIGATLAIKQALKVANLAPNNISYVNAHGTGTPNNDLSESAALKSVFESVPPFSSTKAYTGHTLAASGGIEAVYSVLSIQENCIFPNLNFNEPITETQLTPETELITDYEIDTVLSNSFGFGGNNSSLIFKKN